MNNNTSIFSKYLKSVEKEGVVVASRITINWVIQKLGIRRIDAVHKRRIQISKQIDELFKSTVQYGAFKGLKLAPKTWWGQTDRASMLLGLYEKEVLNSLQNVSNKFNTFIDLGAADGYYGVGVLVNKLFEKSICFEISDDGRRAIRENARINNVLNNIEIRGIAQKDFYHDLPEQILSNSVLFIDIEGAEFELIDKETFKAFSSSVVFIELHDWFFEDGEERLQKLKDDSISTHNITELTMGSRDLSIFPELNTLHDNDRWLICSEGRGQLMKWLKFDPI